MEKYLSTFGHYLLNVLLSTFNQLFVLAGPLLILMVLLNFSARHLAGISVRFWGRNLFLYGFAWLGCSVHELSHAFFALIFGHKITGITLFEPNKDGESMGHVSHSYNKKSYYQQTGNFFIGIAPLLAGGALLFGITWILFGFDLTAHPTYTMTSDILTDVQSLKKLVSGIWSGLKAFSSNFFPATSSTWWRSSILFYALYSVGSSMTLSKPDVRSAFSGFLWIIVIVLIFNLFTLWSGVFSGTVSARWIGYISGFYFLLILSLLSNFLFIIFFQMMNFIKGFFVPGR